MKTSRYRLHRGLYLFLIMGTLLGSNLACQPALDFSPPPLEQAQPATHTLVKSPTATPSPTPSPSASPTPQPSPTVTPTSTPTPTPTLVPITKWELWVGGPHLRGANIYQRRVYPDLDGNESMGPGPVGPPFVAEDFERLSALGANYVNISHPGLFSEQPPYALDPAIQENLDRLLEMIAQADLFAVISFRTGPGRSEFTFFWGDDGDWFDSSYYNDAVWEDALAQEAWAEMWRYTAERYRENPIVVGYDLMVEPNSNDIYFNEWDPKRFHDRYGDTSYDWSQFARRLTAAIREVDGDTPILVGANAYCSVDWLPYLEPTGDPYTIYLVHQYAPGKYTKQGREDPPVSYPGLVDLDYDGIVESFDRTWLEGWLSAVGDFRSRYNLPVAANEYSVVRWAPGAAAFLEDQLVLFEALGMNSAWWVWSSAWAEQLGVDPFNFLNGPDPDHHERVPRSDLMDVLLEYWRRNEKRPSNTPFQSG
jgi:hypothetical protein